MFLAAQPRISGVLLITGSLTGLTFIRKPAEPTVEILPEPWRTALGIQDKAVLWSLSRVVPELVDILQGNSLYRFFPRGGVVKVPVPEPSD